MLAAPVAIDDALATNESTPVAYTGVTDPAVWWQLNETSGSIAADSAGGRDAAITGSVTLGDAGATPATGTSFDLSGGAMQAPYHALMNPAGSFTLEAWAKVEGGQGTFRAVISSRDGNVDADRRGYIIYAASNNTWQFWTGAGTNVWDMVNGPAVVVGQWTHLVATFEAAGGPNAGGTYTGTKTLYVNGQQVAQAANQRYEPNQNLPTRIGYGANESAGTFFFDGDLDNVTIYDQSLSATEVAARYHDRRGVLVNDSDPNNDDFQITAVNGTPAAVGTPVTLPSGAVATVNADGQVAYDPNGAFESLSVGSSTTDSFTYTITDRPPLTEGLVAQYRLDGNALDSSGNGHSGTLQGTVTEVGIIDDALDFNGSSGKLDVPYNAALNPVNFSVSLWARVEGGAGNFRGAISSRDNIASDTRGFVIYAANVNTWQFWTGQGAPAWAQLGTTAVTIGSWVHVVGTFEATSGPNASGAYTGLKSLYLNGALATSAVQLYEPNPVQPLRIGGGANEGAGAFFFDGDLDDVSLWNRAITGTEVNQIYQGRLSSTSVADSLGTTDTATVTVTINGLNDPSTAVNDTIVTTEDVPVSSVVAYSEPFAAPAANAAAINASYPSLNAAAIDASVSGGRLSINTGTSSVGVNVPATPGVDRTIEVDIGAVTASPGSYNVGITIGQNNIVFHPGLASPAGAFRVEGPGGFGNTSLGFVPAAGALHHFRIEENSSSGLFTITVTDGDNPANVFTTSFTNAGSVGGAISLRRSGPNVGSAIFDNFRVGAPSLLSNDSDIDANDTLQAGPVATTSAQSVSVTINFDGTFLYDPGNLFQSLAVGDTAVDSFAYTASDGNGGSSIATVNLTIAGVNDAPIAGNANGGTTDQNTPLNGSGLLTHVSDVDAGDTLSIQPASLVSSGGATVTINANGTFVYDPGTAFGYLAAGNSVVDTFSYTAVDSQGETDSATVSITVTGTNDAPLANDDTGETDEDTVLTHVVRYREPFATAAANAASINAAYAQLDATGADASIAGGVLQINSGDANLAVNAAAGSGRVVTLQVGANTASPGSYNVGFTVGQNHIVFHPGFTGTPGAFRVDGPGGFGNTSLGFVPAVGVLHTMRIVENAVTGQFTVTITDGSNPNNTFTATFTNAASVGGNLSFRRSGGNNGPGLYDNLEVLTADLRANDTDPDGNPVNVIAANPTSAAGAAVTILANGSFSYDPGSVFQYLRTGETATDTFTYTLTDGSATDTATVTVTIQGINDPPANVSAGGPYAIAEGGSLALSGSFTDPDANDTRTITWDLNGDGIFSDASGTSPTLTWAQLQALSPPLNNGPATHSIAFRVNDGTTTVTDTASLVIANANPAVAIAAPASALFGSSVSFTLTPSDPSNADTAAGFAYQIDWGDGTAIETASSVGGAPSTLQHTFSSVALRTVSVTVTDQDGGSSTAQHVIDIVPVIVAGGDLLAVGTSAGDRIIFYPAFGGVQVRYNNTTYPSNTTSFALNANARLVANGLGGNDQLIISAALPYPGVFDGGDSNDYLAGNDAGDTLRGGSGNDVVLGGEGDNLLVGGNGSDRLEGRAGADTIFGGDGSDRLNGGAGNDILDGGSGSDALFGDLGDDLLFGRTGLDTINGYYGNDIVIGGADADLLYGGDGNDLMIGGSGADRLRADGGDDVVVGGTSSLEASLEASLDALMTGGSLAANVQIAIDAWFAVQNAASRNLFAPLGDDGEIDDLTGGGGDDLFAAGAGDLIRDLRSGDSTL